MTNIPLVGLNVLIKMLLNAGVQLYDYFYPFTSFLALQKL